MKKKVFSISILACLMFILSTTVSLASNIVPATLKSEDYATDYVVTKTSAGNVVDITINAKNVVEHENSEGKYGYWVGAAIEAPTGAKKMTYNFEGTIAEKVALEKDVAGEGKDGIALYVDALDPKKVAKVQWLDENDQLIGAETTYKLNATAVTIKIAPAKLASNTYAAEYKVENTLSQINKNEVNVKITAKDIVEHKNGKGEYGYWIGFALEAPEGATGISYTFNDEAGDTNSLEENVTEDGKAGIAFYVDAYKPKTVATVSWVFGQNTGREIKYNIDATEVTLKLPNVTKAILKSEDYAKDYTVTTEANLNKVDVKIVAKDVIEHESANTEGNQYGYWLGFALEAPAGATKVTYEFGNNKKTAVDLEKNVAGEGKDGVAFYVDAANPKKEAKVKWIYDGKIGKEITYAIDTTGVTLKLPTLTPAILASNEYATDYAVTSEFKANEVNVKIVAKNVLEHKNQKDELGYWVGFALTAPEGATAVTYKFGDNEKIATSLEPQITPDGKQGVAFYVNSIDAKPNAIVQWIYGSRSGSKITYNIDVTGVEEKEYTVTFNNNGRGTATTPQKVRLNGKATKPTNPTATSYSFVGWYKEQSCINAYDFNTPVTSDITLYAKWSYQSSGGGGGGGSSSDDIVTYKITVKAGKHGRISPDDDVKVEKGDNQKFRFKPDKG